MIKTSKNVITDDWPIIILLTSDTLAESRHALDVVEEIYKTHQEPYAIVLDARDGRKPSAGERNLQNDFRIKHEKYVRKYCRGSALVSNSEIIKAIAAAMFWFKKPDTVTKVFTDMDEAMAWTRSLLEP
jgi:hypothetical protein